MDMTNENFSLDLPFEVLEKLRQALPYGATKLIAEECGYHPAYVSQILNGAHKLNKNNYKIITSAQGIIRRNVEKKEIIINSINESTNEAPLP